MRLGRGDAHVVPLGLTTHVHDQLPAHVSSADDVAGRTKINKAFEAEQLEPNIVLTAIDSDVIKTYVELGLGVGVLAKMAFDEERDTNLTAIDASHLFESSVTRIGIRRGSYLRRYLYDFIELFAPHLDRNVVDATMAGHNVEFSINYRE